MDTGSARHRLRDMALSAGWPFVSSFPWGLEGNRWEPADKPQLAEGRQREQRRVIEGTASRCACRTKPSSGDSRLLPSRAATGEGLGQGALAVVTVTSTPLTQACRKRRGPGGMGKGAGSTAPRPRCWGRPPLPALPPPPGGSALALQASSSSSGNKSLSSQPTVCPGSSRGSEGGAGQGVTGLQAFPAQPRRATQAPGVKGAAEALGADCACR